MSIERRTGSANSWVKHNLLCKLIISQYEAFRRQHPNGRIVLIDGNAGDGLDIPLSNKYSRSTPHILSSIVDKNADLILCEKNAELRSLLVQQFPHAFILRDHAETPPLIQYRQYDYGIWVSDPCGPKDHGQAAMQLAARSIGAFDFFIIFNEAFIHRLEGRLHDTRRQQTYLPMADAFYWLELLDKKFVARSLPIYASRGFEFRLLIISDRLSDAAKQLEITERRLPMKKRPVIDIERSFVGLRDCLFDELQSLRAGKTKPDRANAVSRLCNEITTSVNVQIDLLRLLGRNGAGKETSEIVRKLLP